MLDREDEHKLREILRWDEEHPEREGFVQVSAFQGMLDRGYPLSDKQRAWVRGVYERLFDVPQYENLISSGKAPRGREVPTPSVLQNLPKKPPHRNL